MSANVITIMCDDLGLGDVSAYGATDLRTPNLDRLLARGVRFDNWHSNAPLCSPSRAALLTGRYPAAAGVPKNVAPEGRGVRPDVPNLAEILSAQGYRTYLSGKWHLGAHDHADLPEVRGFQRTFGWRHGCLDYWSHTFYWAMGAGFGPHHDLWMDGHRVEQHGRYLDTMIADQAMAWLDDASRHAAPFYLHIGFHAPHYPLQAPQSYRDQTAHLPEARAALGAVVLAFDFELGKVLDHLVETGLDDDTIIVFQSDHGPSRERRNWWDYRDEAFPGGSTRGLRGHKASCFEGGIHVPAGLSIPGTLAADSSSKLLGMGFDFVPTILAHLHLTPETIAFDGKNLLPALGQVEEAGEPHQDEVLVWRHNSNCAYRRNEWKLVCENGEQWLCNLAEDPFEEVNLAGEHSGLVDELYRLGQAVDAAWSE